MDEKKDSGLRNLRLHKLAWETYYALVKAQRDWETIVKDVPHIARNVGDPEGIFRKG